MAPAHVDVHRPERHDSSETGFTGRFARFCAAVVRRLPFGLAAVVPPSLLGFALINSCTFGVDLLLLTVFRGVLGLPVAAGFTLAYLIAFGLAFVLNRHFNFRSHAPVGRQAVLYAVAIAINYLAFILGVGGGLVALGLQYHLSRIIAGACEAVYMYSVMRWVIFREPGGRRGRQTRLRE
ncbi:GtrA family protein [Amycolatopsis cihanbeyliensis]|uniref:Putative flippase GtrA n=1 Tax=Amycolatopsis cihanbeyliensis TaxID=1128664 RepID=A0A542CT79_AMYCI|nr:GtrA family protein [Amycolatopsis cihanbeyliensis]TQI94032.1 putative flippase GtrA [Amycolatopsis cihanbeyliensis]